MSIRIALNGFGRIGRNILRAAWNDPDITFVHINDLTNDATLAHLLNNGVVANPLKIHIGCSVYVLW